MWRSQRLLPGCNFFFNSSKKCAIKFTTNKVEAKEPISMKMKRKVLARGVVGSWNGGER